MAVDLDHGASGGRMDVDCGSWSLGNESARPFEAGAIL
jgi:hypothetical protein